MAWGQRVTWECQRLCLSRDQYYKFLDAVHLLVKATNGRIHYEKLASLLVEETTGVDRARRQREIREALGAAD